MLEPCIKTLGFPGGSVDKESAYNAGDTVEGWVRRKETNRQSI